MGSGRQTELKRASRQMAGRIPAESSKHLRSTGRQPLRREWVVGPFVWVLLVGVVQPGMAERPLFPLPGLSSVPWWQPKVQPRVYSARVAPNRMIVRLHPGEPLPAAERVAARLGARVERALPRFGMAVLVFPPREELHQVQSLLSFAPEVEFAEPDFIVYPARIPSDARYGDQWHHPLIRTPEAWDVTTGVRTTVIAIIDSGVDLDHPDIAPNLFTNPGETPNNGKDDDHNGFVDDVHGWDFIDNNNDPSPSPDGKDNDGNGEADDQVTHGTLVAGLAAAASGDFGTVGVSWKARILPLQVFPDDGGATTSRVIEAIDYAISMGVDVVNLSLGVASYVRSFDTPIATCYANGITVVAAAGNGQAQFTAARSTWHSPACNDGPNVGVDNYVIGVAATDQQDRRCSFSNYDNSGYRFVDVSAPGQAVFGPGYQDNSKPAFQAYFARGTGTSFSAPLVSGLAALLKAYQPGITNAQIIERIRGTADNIDGANPGFAGKLGTGRINAARAVGVDLRPAPVRNLRAEDTPGDEGGSITLRWLRSTDDGGGANDVVEYLVKRSRNATGPFRLRASVPAGSDSYVDTDLPNHVEFYYVVTTLDAAGKKADSEVAGPASARDDLPPPPVKGVVAEDEPNDAGGAIRITWDPYPAPADFAAFRIYRSRYSFTTVDGMTPLAVVTDSNATSYVDTTASDGVDYWYAVTAVDEEPNEIKDVTAVGPAQSFPNHGVAIGPGLHFMATPIVPQNRDPAAFFGVPPEVLPYVRFDPEAMGGMGQYIFYQMAPTSQFMLLDFGKGFWFYTSEALELNPVGDVAPNGPFAIDLKPGWRQIGNPFLSPIDFSAATVEEGSLTMDLPSAEAAGIMRRFAWVYERSVGDYRLIDRVVGTDHRLISPWEGMWVHVMKSCRLVLDRAAVSPSAMGPSSAPKRPAWQIRLVAQTVEGVDAANYVGVASEPDRLNIEAPPAFLPKVKLDLEAEGTRVPFAAVFRRPSAQPLQWSFTVSTATPGQVTIMAPDLSPVPPQFSVVLTDLDACRKVHLRTAPSYRYVAQRSGERHFRLTVGPNTTLLAVAGLTSTPVRSGGVEVRFSLSATARCDVEVLNVAGRTVRKLAIGKECEAGQQVILWNGRNDNGVVVPSGTYLIRVRARSAAGGMVQALARTMVLR